MKVSDHGSRQRLAERLVRVYRLLDALDDLPDVVREAHAGKDIVADAQDIIRREAFDRAEAARDEMEAICAWLDTLPWKGPGSLRPGEMIENIRRGAHRRGRES